MFRKLAFIVGVVAVCLFGVLASNAGQWFSNAQAVQGTAEYDWSFMTAWNLDDGSLQVSDSWYDGNYWFIWTEQYYQSWTALFLYDSGTGTTRELKWSYCQRYYGH